MLPVNCTTLSFSPVPSMKLIAVMGLGKVGEAVGEADGLWLGLLVMGCGAVVGTCVGTVGADVGPDVGTKVVGVATNGKEIKP